MQGYDSGPVSAPAQDSYSSGETYYVGRQLSKYHCASVYLALQLYGTALHGTGAPHLTPGSKLPTD